MPTPEIDQAPNLTGLAHDVADLLSRACPNPEDVPFFNQCMTLARDRGMTWEEGLRYAIVQRERHG